MRRGKLRLKIACAVAGVVMMALALRATPVAAQDSAPASSKERAAKVIASMTRAKRISDVAISPDGRRVAYVIEGKLHIGPVERGSAPGTLSTPEQPVRDVAWTADGEVIAFVADLPGDMPRCQIWTASADATNATKRVELKGYAEAPRFSPDGKTLSILYIENMPRVAGPLEPMTPLSGEIGEKVYEQRIATIDLATNKLKQVTPPDVYAYEYEWTPDGKGWVATAAHGSGDANWYVAHLYAIDAATGAMRDIYTPKFQIADPRVSPDGKNVAFIEGLMSDEGSTGGDVYLIPIDGGTPKNLTPNLHGSPRAIVWTAFTGLLSNQNVDGDSAIVEIPLDDRPARTLWTGADFVRPGGSAWAAPKALPQEFDRLETTTVAVVRQSANMPPEVWAGPPGKWKQITHLSGLKPARGAMLNIHWMNGDSRVQGWLTQPKDYDPQKKYPLVVVVHGGPSAACENSWTSWGVGDLSAMGYFVLCANPRGSFGQGEAYVRGNVKDFGGGDFHDIMAGIDYVLANYPVDPARLGIFGHSYGGYMTMWAETQTNRFAAAVAGAGLSDWLSYYGVNDIDEWMMPFFGASIYDDPAVYAKSDPMHFVKNVKTPTLILVGDRDGEVPMEQSVEWRHALDAEHVPVRLVVYPNEGHGMGNPVNSRDYRMRTLEWFDEWFSKVK
ncbi:MAG: S9 family peptidase [Candidatus Acidiferrales bacterium]